MLSEMRGQKTEKTTEKKEGDKMVKVVGTSPKKSRQIASTATAHTSTATSAIGVLVIACDRPTVTRALALLLKLVIKITCT